MWTTYQLLELPPPPKLPPPPLELELDPDELQLEPPLELEPFPPPEALIPRFFIIFLPHGVTSAIIFQENIETKYVKKIGTPIFVPSKADGKTNQNIIKKQAINQPT